MSVEKWIRAESLEAEECHRRYRYAPFNSIERKILRLLMEGKSGEWGFCIERKGKQWVVTKEGEIVDRIKN
jgi:hypothetical protein